MPAAPASTTATATRNMFEPLGHDAFPRRRASLTFKPTHSARLCPSARTLSSILMAALIVVALALFTVPPSDLFPSHGQPLSPPIFNSTLADTSVRAPANTARMNSPDDAPPANVAAVDTKPEHDTVPVSSDHISEATQPTADKRPPALVVDEKDINKPVHQSSDSKLQPTVKNDPIVHIKPRNEYKAVVAQSDVEIVIPAPEEPQRASSQTSDEKPAAVQSNNSVNSVDVKANADVAPSAVSTDSQHKAVVSESVRADTNAVSAPASNNSPDPADFSTFSPNTALNYFHLHKTGGVSFKERLFDFFFKLDKVKPNGHLAVVLDTCHMSGPPRPDLGIESEWSCDWAELQKMAAEKRNTIDVIVGHQYWKNGAEELLKDRDVRYFTIMRHPLHRKISFYYHFFVRNSGRTEASVPQDEIVQFVLAKKMPRSPLIRDGGPGYYASRLWSDGWSGFSDHHLFNIAENEVEELVARSIQRLRRHFVFIGLQVQEKASLCMLKKTVEAFSKAHGITNMDGLDNLAKQRQRMNTGSYGLSGKILWDRMSEQEREEFRKVERVDLAIYKESVKMFHEMARRLDCAHLIERRDDDAIAL